MASRPNVNAVWRSTTIIIISLACIGHKGIGWAHCISIGTGAFQTLLVVDELGKICATGQANGLWSSWRYFATAEPPQEYDLPLSAGIIALATPRNKYWLTQFGEVFIEINAGTDNPQVFLSNRTIATLPMGFIPKIDCHRVLAARNYEGTAGYPVLLSVSASNGSISINSFGNPVSVIHALISFKL